MTRGIAALLLAVLCALSGCAGSVVDGAPGGAADRVEDTSTVRSATRPSATSRADDGPAPTARVGRPARSTRVRFQPTQVVLPGNQQAAVVPAATVDGELKVPTNVDHVGWWDGSAYAGDPFGSTVVAGHVDSATQGVGFFVRLLGMEVGQRVTVRGEGHELSYRVVSVQTVARRALASDTAAFDQTGDHRLVLITCTGAYHPDRGGYDSNLVVIAAPVGLAR